MTTRSLQDAPARINLKLQAGPEEETRSQTSAKLRHFWPKGELLDAVSLHYLPQYLASWGASTLPDARLQGVYVMSQESSGIQLTGLPGISVLESTPKESLSSIVSRELRNLGHAHAA